MLSHPILYFASDHAGFNLKSTLLNHAVTLGYEVVDLGATSEESVDYPDYADRLSQKLKYDDSAIGVLICGTGIGVSIAANRYKWIRAAVCNHSLKVTKLARAHNHANVLCLGARLVENRYAKNALEVFLKTPWEDGRHATRVQKMSS